MQLRAARGEARAEARAGNWLSGMETQLLAAVADQSRIRIAFFPQASMASDARPADGSPAPVAALPTSQQRTGWESGSDELIRKPKGGRRQNWRVAAGDGWQRQSNSGGAP